MLVRYASGPLIGQIYVHFTTFRVCSERWRILGSFCCCFFFCFRDELLKIDFEVLTKNQSIHQSNLRRWKQKFLHAVCYQNLGGYNIRQILNKLWWYDGGALRKVILLEHLWTSIKQCQKTNSRAHTNSRRQTRQANNCCVTHSCSAMSFWMSRYEGVLDLK